MQSGPFGTSGRERRHTDLRTTPGIKFAQPGSDSPLRARRLVERGRGPNVVAL